MDGAKAAWQQAIDSGDDVWAPDAAFLLGDLLKEQGDIAGAKGAYQQARDSGVDLLWAPAAADRLRELPGEQDPGR